MADRTARPITVADVDHYRDFCRARANTGAEHVDRVPLWFLTALVDFADAALKPKDTER